MKQLVRFPPKKTQNVGTLSQLKELQMLTHWDKVTLLPGFALSFPLARQWALSLQISFARFTALHSRDEQGR